MHQPELKEWEIVPYHASEIPPGPWLIVSPHPDDETIGMGGTIAKGSALGTEIHVLEVTDGELGGDPKIRRGEAIEALKLLGVPEENIHFAGMKENELSEGLLSRLLEKMMLSHNILTLFVPSPLEPHPCHRATSLAVIRWLENNYQRMPEELKVAFYEISRESEVNTLICIEPFVKTKARAIMAYSSQRYRKYLHTALGINAARSYTLKECRFAEGFFITEAGECNRVFSQLHLYAAEYTHEKQLLYSERMIELLKSELWGVKQEAQELDKKNIELSKSIQALQLELKNREKLISTLKHEIKKEKDKIDALEREASELRSVLEQVENSLLWKACKAYYSATVKLLPEGTLRRRLYSLAKKVILITFREGPFTAIGRAKEKVLRELKGKRAPQYSTSIPYRPNIRIIPRKDSEVSAVTVLYKNPAEEVNRMLRSLTREGVKEVIAVDNSPDARLMEVVSKHPNAKYFHSGANLGFGKAVNLGIEKASSQLILVINPDTEVREGAVPLLAGVLLNNPQVGLAECMQLPYEHPKFYNPVTLEPVWASGCCFMVRREEFLSIGGFDEGIFLYGEDVDLSWRYMLAGYRLAYIPSARVWHNPHSERSHLHRHSPQSNLYLRLKYRAPLIEWFITSLLAGRAYFPPPKTLKRALRLRKETDHKAKEVCYFEPYGFGYEPLRRRGEMVKVPELRENPLVTVVIRTHNRPHMLERALATVSHQTYRNIEVLVIEDRSRTAEKILDQYPHLNTRYFYTEGGRTRALNMGLKNASGDFILFLDDDDMLFADAIEVLVGYAIEEQRGFVYGGSLKFETDNKIDGILKYGYFQEFDRQKMMIENYIPMGSFIISKNLAEAVGEFDETLEYLEDWDFIRRAAMLHDFLFVPKDLLIYCVPMDPREFWKRQAKLDEAYSKVVGKKI